MIPIFFPTIQLVILVMCTKFQDSRYSSYWEIWHKMFTHTQIARTTKGNNSKWPDSTAPIFFPAVWMYTLDVVTSGQGYLSHALAQSSPYYHWHSLLSLSLWNCENLTVWGWHMYLGTLAICWSAPDSGMLHASYGVVDCTCLKNIFIQYCHSN